MEKNRVTALKLPPTQCDQFLTMWPETVTVYDNNSILILIFRLVLMFQYEAVAYLGEHSVRVFKNKVLRRKFWLAEELTED